MMCCCVEAYSFPILRVGPWGNLNYSNAMKYSIWFNIMDYFQSHPLTVTARS